MRYNPPPTWPPPPHAGWQPPPGWKPNPRWGPPPPGWQLWIDDRPPAPQQSLPTPAPPAHEPPNAHPFAKFGGAIKHPVWISVGTVVGALSLVVALVAMNTSRQDQGDLVVASVSMDNISEINGTVDSTVSTVSTAQEPIDSPQKTAPVDITIKNNSNQPATINEIRGEVLQFSDLPDCGRFGGGPAQLTASYGLIIPTQRNPDSGGVESSASRISTQTDFTIPANSVGRMEVTFGPDIQNISHARPKVMAIRITLIPENGLPLEVGTAGGVTTSGIVDHIVRNESDFAGKSECNSANLAELTKMNQLADVRSPLLDQLSGVYERNT